ncbi:unnamed protein product [Brachionus calyciflorus]|uniref:Membrane-associated tyrosine- and threonine-specific cdc2-inhibitory kinase n=1 Tax=Brachionus calyciflorus TaxID=104777 RepID=A0A813R872_9BILA|nr:unnamed protein product [Brachionus calyciflorus]
MEVVDGILQSTTHLRMSHLIDEYKNSQLMNNSGVNMSPKARPLPKFFAETTQFSTKKERETPKLSEIHPPKPPIKSCPPISRLRPQRKCDYEGARVISFLNKNSQNDPELISKYYDDKKKDLFFEQCFIIEGNLGCGSFGKVYKVKSKEDGKYYAVKKSREKFKGSSDRVRKLEEVAKHEELPPHPNFVKFYRAWEERQRLYIQTELCQMSLSAFAEKQHDIPEETIWQFLVDLLQALKHLHDKKFVHMDIKPENIFISFENNCKLGDFGLVIDLEKNDLREVQEGDPKYLAPEVLHSNYNITCAADVFSLGMTILELATDLDLPRGGEPWHQLRNGQIPSHLVSTLSNDLVEIIIKMIEPDHLKRAKVDELLEMPKIRSLIRKNKRKLMWCKMTKYLKCSLTQAKSLSFSMLQFFLYPFYKMKNFIEYFSNDKQGVKYSKLNITSDNSNDENLEKQNTSTPKKEECSNAIPIALMHVDDDDAPDQHILINDSFTGNNNSYLNPLIDSSSSFSDQSEFSIQNRFRSARKTHTEPPLSKIQKPFVLNLEMSPTSSLSPTRTPPWKQLSLHNSKQEATPLSFTRQKLIFDEEDDDNKENIQSKIENKNVRTKYE